MTEKMFWAYVRNIVASATARRGGTALLRKVASKQKRPPFFRCTAGVTFILILFMFNEIVHEGSDYNRGNFELLKNGCILLFLNFRAKNCTDSARQYEFQKKPWKLLVCWKKSRNCNGMVFCRSLDFGVKIQSSDENHRNANFNNSATSSLNFSVIFKKLAKSFLLRSLIKSLQHFLWPCVTTKTFWGVIHLIIDSRNGCDCSYKSY